MQALEQQLAPLLPEEKGKRAYMVRQVVANAHRSSNRVCLRPAYGHCHRVVQPSTCRQAVLQGVGCGLLQVEKLREQLRHRLEAGLVSQEELGRQLAAVGRAVRLRKGAGASSISSAGRPLLTSSSNQDPNGMCSACAT